jgi:hypothetical protein
MLCRYGKGDLTLSTNNHKKNSNTRFDGLFSAAKSSDLQLQADDKEAKKSKSTDPEFTQTTLYLRKRLHKRLKAAAADEERDMSEIVGELIENWLKHRVSKDI